MARPTACAYQPRMTRTLADTPDGIAAAAALLRAGQLVAFATETVYGLGADATDPAAIAALYAAKGRPAHNPLICHYPDTEAALADIVPHPDATRLAAAFWPGPLTLVGARRDGCRVTSAVSAGGPTLAVRVPGHATARALLAAAGRPIAAPSANRSGGVSPTTAAHVLDGLAGRIAAVLDSGACPVGIESTVVDLTGPAPRLLRPGGIGADALAAAGIPVLAPMPTRMPTQAGTQASRPLLSPGLLASHYAPAAPVRLGATAAAADEALLAFGPVRDDPSPSDGPAAVWNLSARGDVEEAAARLYAGLRELDAEVARRRLRGIAVMAVPETGIGAAINDRLRRAAAPR